MTVETILIPILTALVGGGGVWTFVTQRRQRLDTREEAEIVRLRLELRELKDAHAQCHKDIASLEQRLDTIEQHHLSQLARWIKDDDKRIRWVNSRAMMLIFAPLGYSRSDIEGQTFAEIGLDGTSVTEIDRLDRLAVMHPGEAATTMLTLRRVDAPPGSIAELPPLFIAKVAGIGRGGDLVYEGCAFRGIGDSEADRIGDLRQAEQRGVSTLRRLGEIKD
jgi:hypothetical protein